MNEVPVYFISDHTGMTAEVMGRSLLAQFEDVPVQLHTRPFVDSLAKADMLLRELESCVDPIVVLSIADEAVLSRLRHAPGTHLDLFAPFLHRIEERLGTRASGRVGAFHGINDLERYTARIDAVEYALSTDDGASTTRYSQADVILVGPSRVGKTPTCLFLGMQFGVAAANYPLADDDFSAPSLPPEVAAYRDRLFGLTIDPMRLQHLRDQRKPGTSYSAFEQCEREIRAAERLFRRAAIPYRNTTTMSVEELAAVIVETRGLARNR